MDFAAALATWQRVLTQPGVPVFEQEKMSPNANLTTAIIWVVIAAVISGILGWIQLQFFSAGMNAALGALPPELQSQMAGLTGGGFGLWAIILTPILFIVGVLLMHVVAQALGGKGDMGVLAYLVASYQAPITIASAVLGLIPFLGGCVAFILAIYGIVLSYFAAQANYGLTGGRAIVVALVPLVVGVCVGGFVATALIGPALSGI